MKNSSLKIVKVAAQKSPQYEQKFRSQPINYLKIIENKDKVKYEYLNKDFDPKQDLKQLSGRRLDYPNPNIYNPDGHHSPTPHPTFAKTPALKGDLSKYTFDIPLDSDDEDFRPRHPPRPPPRPVHEEPTFVAPHPSYTPPRPQTITHTETYSPPRTPTHTHTPPQTPPRTPQRTPDTHTHEPVYNYDMHTPPKEESQYSRLRDFLNGSDNEESDDDYYAKRRIHKDKVIDPNKYMSTAQQQFNKMNTGPPTLDELEKRGEYSSRKEYMDVFKMNEMLKRERDDDVRSERSTRPPRSVSSRISVDSRYSHSHTQPSKPKVEIETEETIDDKKRDFLCKLDMLRKKYPEYAQNLPFMTMNNSLKELQNVYYAELRKLEIDSNASDYRQYLIYGFMITEFILGNFLRLDLEGFTQQQLLNMRRYDRLLIELGEKNYVPDGKKWPVELRLVGIIIIQAAAFTAAKMVLKKTGTNLMGMFNAAVHTNNASQNQGEPKRKMRQPDVDLSDIDMDDDE